MEELLAQEMNRRRLLKMAGGAAAAGLAFGAAPASARTSAGNIKMWWWGEQEAVGIQTWMDDTIKKFKAQTGSSVSPTLMDTAQVIPQFTKAAAAGARARRAVPVQRDLPHGERLARLPQAAQRPRLRRDDQAGRRHDALELPGQDVPHGLLLAGLRRPVQQGALRQGRPQRRLAAEDVGRVHGRLRQAQVEGLHPARRRRQGRLPRRVVARQRADPEPEQPGRRAQPVHRQARLAHAEVPRALGQAAGALRRGVLNDDVNSLDLYRGIQLYNTGKASMALNNTAALPDSQKKLGDEASAS